MTREKNNARLFERNVTKPWRGSERFIQFPRLIIVDKQLSHGAVKLATVLSCFDLPKPDRRPDKRVRGPALQGIVFPGNKTLADAMGVSEPMIIQYKKELQKAGYLQERKRFSKTNLHIFKFPKMESVEDIVQKYRLFAVPISAEDFKGIVERDFMESLVRFFKVVKEVKEKYREQMDEESMRKLDSAEMEKTALEWYENDESGRD